MKINTNKQLEYIITIHKPSKRKYKNPKTQQHLATRCLWWGVHLTRGQCNWSSNTLGHKISLGVNLTRGQPNWSSNTWSLDVSGGTLTRDQPDWSLTDGSTSDQRSSWPEDLTKISTQFEASQMGGTSDQRSAWPEDLTKMSTWPEAWPIGGPSD